MTASLPVEIIPQLSQAQAVLERHLAGNLQAIHLFGSAVDGGLKPHSDIDLMVTVSNALAGPVRRSLMMDLLSVSAAAGADGPWRPLEVTLVVQSEVVPWRYPPLRELQFGEWLREELQAGIIPPAVPDHDLAILFTKVRQHSACMTGAPAEELFNPVPEADFSQALLDTVAQWNDEPDWQGDERNVVLALARIWFSAVTGEIAPKDVAAAWALERLPDEHRPVLAMARAAYLGGAEDGLAHRGAEVAAFVRQVRAVIESACAARAMKPWQSTTKSRWQIRSAATSDVEAIHRLLASNGWAHRIPDARYLGQLISASHPALIAVADGEVVGFARAISDGLSNGYLSMVVVAEPFRRKGIGQALVRHIVGSDTGITWVLRAARPGATEFFSKLGFRTSPAAMERSRERPIPETRSSLGQQRRQAELEHRLTAMVAASDPLMAALRAVRSLRLRSWCIGAGAIRSLVWDTLHGFDHRSPLNDMDVVYFDANAGPEHDAHLEKQLRYAMPNLCWEVTNQAGVHRWFADALGQVVAPLASLEEGVGTWPEFATCVGVYLNAVGTLGVIAPHGLDDLFGLRVRHNPQRASAATYRERVQAKRFAERWPRLSIDAG